MDKFFCCKKNANFERIKNGYKCMECGKVFRERMICYSEEMIEFMNKKTYQKFKGRKSEYMDAKEQKILSTLQTGIVTNQFLNDDYEVINKKEFKVKKSVLIHRLNLNDTFLTITDNGVVNVYNTKTEEMFSEVRLGMTYDKVEVLPFGNEGKWIFIDTEKIGIFSNDFKKFELVLLFKNVLDCNEIMRIFSVDYNSAYDNFVVHVGYRLVDDKDTRMKKAIFVLKMKSSNIEVEQFKCENVCIELTYDYEKHTFYGICDDKMIRMSEKNKIEEVLKLPFVKKYSDGGGIFWVEEFISYPEKLYFLSDNVVVLHYLGELIVFDIDEKEIKYSYTANGNLIQSFTILDKETICFSAGLNTYIVKCEISK